MLASWQNLNCSKKSTYGNCFKQNKWNTSFLILDDSLTETNITIDTIRTKLVCFTCDKVSKRNVCPQGTCKTWRWLRCWINLLFSSFKSQYCLIHCSSLFYFYYVLLWSLLLYTLMLYSRVFLFWSFNFIFCSALFYLCVNDAIQASQKWPWPLNQSDFWHIYITPHDLLQKILLLRWMCGFKLLEIITDYFQHCSITMNIVTRKHPVLSFLPFPILLNLVPFSSSLLSCFEVTGNQTLVLASS